MTETITLPSTRREFTALQSAIFECVVYSDIFDFAVTASEIQRVLPIPASIDDVERALIAPDITPGLIETAGGYFFLAGRADLVDVRRRRERSSQRLLRHAGLYGSLIARLPFVRMVAVTGSLAVRNADEGDDIDYLIVTAPGRVWLARALAMAVVRLAAMRGVTLCPNYVLSEDAVGLDERDIYTARELLQMLPLSGEGVYRHMLESNGWWHDYLPNASPKPLSQQHDSWLQRLGEALLPSVLAMRLERLIFGRKAAELQRQPGGSDEVQFDTTMCKGHVDGHRRRTVEALRQRLRKLEQTT